MIKANLFCMCAMFDLLQITIYTYLPQICLTETVFLKRAPVLFGTTQVSYDTAQQQSILQTCTLKVF